MQLEQTSFISLVMNAKYALLQSMSINTLQGNKSFLYLKETTFQSLLFYHLDLFYQIRNRNSEVLIARRIYIFILRNF